MKENQYSNNSCSKMRRRKWRRISRNSCSKRKGGGGEDEGESA